MRVGQRRINTAPPLLLLLLLAALVARSAPRCPALRNAHPNSPQRSARPLRAITFPSLCDPAGARNRTSDDDFIRCEMKNRRKSFRARRQSAPLASA